MVDIFMFNLLKSLYSTRVDTDERLLEIIEDSKTKVSKYFGIPKYLLDLKYKIARLPEIYEVGIKRIGNYVLGHFRKIGKVLGIFNPFTDEVYIDPINLENERYLRRTITHELIHKAQKILGKFGYSRYFLEREADLITEKLI